MAMSGSLLGNIGFTGLNLALPGMERELSLSAALLGWVPLSMFMAMAAVAAPGAKLADILGRRRTTIAALIVSLVGLAISALAWDAAGVLFGRVLAGLGVAMVFTNATSMVTSVHPPQMRGRVLGYTIASVYLGLSLGPVVCGYLVGWFGWRSVFWLSFAGFIPPLALILPVRVEQRPAQGQKLNGLSSFLWVASVLCLFFGLPNITHLLPGGPIMVAVGLVLAWGYVRHSLTSENPVLDVRLFTASRRFAFSSLASFISYCASMGTGFILSLYLQYTKGLPTATAGLLLVAQPVFMTILTPFAGRLSDRVDAGLMASFGMGVLCVTTVLLAVFLTPEASLTLFIVLSMLLGLGFAVFSAPNSNAIIGSAPPGQVGQASGILTAARLCGQVFSISLTTLIFTVVIGPGEITPDRYPAFMEAATLCLTIFAPIMFIGILASLARGKRDA
jgi:MFS family permease